MISAGSELPPRKARRCAAARTAPYIRARGGTCARGTGHRAGHPRARPGTQVLQTLDLWSLMHPKWLMRCARLTCGWCRNTPGLYERVYQLDERTWRRIIEGEQPPPAGTSRMRGSDHCDTRRRRATRAARGSICARLRTAATALFVDARGDGEHAVERCPFADAAPEWIWARLSRRLERRLRMFRPHVVVGDTDGSRGATFGRQARGAVSPCPASAVPTDYGVHDFWLQPGTDALLCCPRGDPGAAKRTPRCTGVGDGRAADAWLRCGRPRHRGEVALGLDPSRPVVLVLGGGLGIGVDVVAERLLAKRLDAELVLITGHNQRLCARARVARGGARGRCTCCRLDREHGISTCAPPISSSASPAA